jgi:hypothetical protein
VRGPKIIREPGTSYVTLKRERNACRRAVVDDLLEHHVWFVLREEGLTRDVDRRVEAREAPQVRPSGTYGPTAIAGASASRAPTSCPDIRLPVSVSPFGAQPTARASLSVSTVGPIPVSGTKRASTSPTRTGSVTRWSRYAEGVPPIGPAT